MKEERERPWPGCLPSTKQLVGAVKHDADAQRLGQVLLVIALLFEVLCFISVCFCYQVGRGRLSVDSLAFLFVLRVLTKV